MLTENIYYPFFYYLFSLWCILWEKHSNNLKSIFTYRHQQIHDWKWFAWLYLLKSSTTDHLQTRAGKTFELKRGWDYCFHLGWTENLGFWYKSWHSKLKNSNCSIGDVECPTPEERVASPSLYSIQATVIFHQASKWLSFNLGNNGLIT